MYIKPFCISSTKYSLHINEWPSKHISINVNFPLQTLFTYFSLIILSKPSQIFFLCAQSCKNLFSLIHVPLKLKVLSIFMICWHAYLHIHHANYKLTVPCRHRHTHTHVQTHTHPSTYTHPSIHWPVQFFLPVQQQPLNFHQTVHICNRCQWHAYN